MKKFFVLTAIFAAIFLTVSCDDDNGEKKCSPYIECVTGQSEICTEGSKAWIQVEGSDKKFECEDKENCEKKAEEFSDFCFYGGNIEGPDSENDNPDSDNPDTTPDNSDSANDGDSSDSTPDNGDSTPEQPDDADSESDDDVDSQSDDTDSESDDDTDSQSDDADSESDDDADSQSDDDADSQTEPTEAEKCSTAGGNWSATEEKCTKTTDCTGKPENADWNGASSYTQTYTNGAWSAETTAEYSTEEGVCHFKCAEGYFWDEPNCKKPLDIAQICTGQNKCYNKNEDGELETCPASPSGTDDDYNFYGQDAQYTDHCTAQNFSVKTPVEGQNVVFDHNTGLTWEQTPSEETYAWEDHATHCNELNTANYAGISDWRVPNPLELLTIVDNSTSDPATNSNFTGMMATNGDKFLWTNQENTGFYIPTGWYAYRGKGETFKVLCVSGEEMKPAVSDDFTTSSDGLTVTDTRNGLMWQKEYAREKKWQQALEYCENLSYAGYTDWRLPNKHELSSLINYEKTDQPFSYFPDTPSDNSFWSSSTYALDDTAEYAWTGYDDAGFNSKIYSHYVRCVR